MNGAAASLSIFLIVVIALAFLILRRTYLSFHFRNQQYKVRVNGAVAPVVGVLLMLATGCIHIGDVGRGIAGDDQLQPYGIVILFMCMAYMSNSLDMTGGLTWLALKVTSMSKGTGTSLFFFFFGCASFVTLFTSNDITVMTMTPLIYYFSVATGLNPIPFLAAQFAAANIWGMALFTGNPTNIIVTDAFNLTFWGYSKWMILPTIAAGMGALVFMYLSYRKEIRAPIRVPNVNASLVLSDTIGAVFGVVVIVACLVTLLVAPSVGWTLWIVTVVFCGIHVIFNLFRYVILPFRLSYHGISDHRDANIQLPQLPQLVPLASSIDTAQSPRSDTLLVDHSQSDPVLDAYIVHDKPFDQPKEKPLPPDPATLRTHEMVDPPTLRPTDPLVIAVTQSLTESKPLAGDVSQPIDSPSSVISGVESVGAKSNPSHTEIPQDQSPTKIQQPASDAQTEILSNVSTQNGKEDESSRPLTGDELVLRLRCGVPSFGRVLKSLPWDVIPFVLSMFILVEGLCVNGWIERLASAFGKACTTIPITVVVMALSSVVVGGVICNQPMTILFTRICMHEAFKSAVSSSNHMASLFAVIISSNLAATLTILGALAGIMWSDILARKGMHIGYFRFMKLLLPCGIACLALSILVLGIEVATF